MYLLHGQRLQGVEYFTPSPSVLPEPSSSIETPSYLRQTEEDSLNSVTSDTNYEDQSTTCSQAGLGGVFMGVTSSGELPGVVSNSNPQFFEDSYTQNISMINSDWIVESEGSTWVTSNSNSQFFKEFNTQNDSMSNSAWVTQSEGSSQVTSNSSQQFSKKSYSQDNSMSNSTIPFGNQITIPQPLNGRKHMFGDLSCLILRSSNLKTVDKSWYSHTPAITVLILSDNFIEKIPDDMPCYMPSLRRLSVDRNRICALPETVSLWKDMRHLILGTEAGGNPLETLPKAIGEMEGLVSLEAANCRLTYLEKGVFGSSLEHLDLSHNRLQGLSGEPFINCSRLSILNLKNNEMHTFCQDFVDRMAALFENGLNTLNLEHNKIPVLPLDLSIKALEKIWVEGNPLVKSSAGTEEEELRTRYQTIVQKLLLRPIPNINASDTSHNSSADWMAQQVDPYSTENDRVDAFLKSCSSDLESVNIPSLDNYDYQVRSLREIAFRNIHSTTVPPSLPFHLKIAFKLKKDCFVCKGPYLSEWINSLQWKYSRGNLFLCKARICSSKCWQDYIDSIHQKSFHLSNENVRERARRFIQENDSSDSMTWIVAATVAESEAIRRIELTANGY